MAMRAQWNDRAVFSECPTCQHMGPHLPDALGMLRCDVCGSMFAAGPAATGVTTTTYADSAPDDVVTTSWIPDLPDGD